MLNMNKKIPLLPYIIILPMVAMVGSVITVTTGCGAGGGVTSNTSVVPSSRSRAMVNVQFTLSDQEVANLPPGFIERAAAEGMTRTANGFVKTVPAARVAVSDGTHATTTDDNGYFTIPGSTSGRSVNTLHIVTDKQMVPLSQAISRATNGDNAWTAEVVYNDCCKGMGIGADSTSAAASRDIHDGRCLDYNGWYSDHHNYSLRDNPTGALKNFVGSDCFFALRFCVLDHLYNGGCMARHGGCSRFIGHSQNEHWHN